MLKHSLVAIIGILILTGCITNSEKQVTITQSAFVPEVLKVKLGDTVIFVNKDVKPHWPASANHPDHTNYPEEGGCIGSKFDSCGPLKTGEKFYFTFNKKGNWSYHDHVDSGLTGLIIVE